MPLSFFVVYFSARRSRVHLASKGVQSARVTYQEREGFCFGYGETVVKRVDADAPSRSSVVGLVTPISAAARGVALRTLVLRGYFLLFSFFASVPPPYYAAGRARGMRARSNKQKAK